MIPFLMFSDNPMQGHHSLPPKVKSTKDRKDARFSTVVLGRKVPFSFWKVFLPPSKEGAKRRLFTHCWPKREREIERWKDRELNLNS
jgi:hypothetical protein